MGKDCGSWLHRQHYPWKPPNPNCAGSTHDPGQQNIVHSMAYPVYANPYTFSASASRTAPRFAAAENPEMKSFCGNEPEAWSSYYPHQTFTPTPKFIPGEKFYVSQCGEAAPNQKKFLVFDQSGNRTSLVFSSVGYPFQNPFSSNLKPSDTKVSRVELPINKETLIPDSVKKASWYGLDEKHETDVLGGSGSEMHEDTEELDALLCSDDDEETSTGHSPSEMTGYEKHEVIDGTEVASSATPTKRRRLEGEHDLSLIDTASSGKEWNYEDDAMSSYIKGWEPGEGGSSASKRLRRKRIRETVDVLRNIIPGGKGKDAMVVLDEAVQYLKSMRLKAKALGAATLM